MAAVKVTVTAIQVMPDSDLLSTRRRDTDDGTDLESGRIAGLIQPESRVAEYRLTGPTVTGLAGTGPGPGPGGQRTFAYRFCGDISPPPHLRPYITGSNFKNLNFFTSLGRQLRKSFDPSSKLH